MKPASRPAAGARAPAPADGKKKNTLAEIQRMEREREERRKAQNQARVDRSAEEQRNIDNGTPGDVDFQRMIAKFRQDAPPELPHKAPGPMKICICVRKRPISKKEVDKRDYDSVTCLHPVCSVHYCKLKVDGIHKYLDNVSFQMDHVFGEYDTTDDLYYYSVQPLIEFVIGGGRATVFAYGQTGSGKTYTMQGVQKFVADDLFYGLAAAQEENEANGSAVKAIEVYVTFFEIYGGRCQDLLNERNKLIVREDGNGEVVVADLLEVQVTTAEDMLAVIDSGNSKRTTHATESNEESSRSHAICQIVLKKVDAKGRSRLLGKLSLIDLAGSERGADTKSHNRTRRMEGAEINKSLLALKECVRALDSNSTHVPYRASKLTLVLKDSFTKGSSRTVMIVNISPAASSADHTLNTLRYADRIKETQVGDPAAGQGQGQGHREREREDKDRSPSPYVSPPPAPSGAGAAAAARERDSHPQPPNPRGIAAGGGAASKPALAAAPASYRSPPVPDRAAAEKAPSRALVGRDEKLSRDHHQHQNVPTSRARRPSEEAYDGGMGRIRLESRDAEDDDDTVEDDPNPYGDDSEDQELGETAEEKELNRTIQHLFDEEEELLNLHMNNIQENAELLTEEGKLLQQLQGDDNNDIDVYTNRLETILERKMTLIRHLQGKLAVFKQHLQDEEKVSKKVAAMGKY